MTAQGRRFILVSGKLDDGDSFVPTWWVTPSPTVVREWRQPAGEHEWSVRAVRGTEEVARATAPVIETPVCRTTRTERRVAALLELPPDTTAIAIFRAGQQVYRREVPDRASVQVRDLGERRLPRGPLQIAMDIDARVPSEGAYVVLRWEMRGARATPLAFVPVTGGRVSAEVDLTHAPGGRDGRLVAVYHDGVNSESVTVDGLELPPRPARPRIVLPLDHMRLSEHGAVPLEGELDGDGDSAALEWRVDGASVARGARAGVRLPAGPHTVTLSHGAEEITVSIEVIGAIPEARSEPITPPWRTRPVHVAATPRPAST